MLGQRLYLGGGRNPPPSVGLLIAAVYLRVRLSPLVVVNQTLCLALTGLLSPPSHNPPSRFQDCFRGVASACRFLFFNSSAALIRRPGRPSENARGASLPACPTHRARANIPAVKSKARRAPGDSNSNSLVDDCLTRFAHLLYLSFLFQSRQIPRRCRVRDMQEFLDFVVGDFSFRV